MRRPLVYGLLTAATTGTALNAQGPESFVVQVVPSIYVVERLVEAPGDSDFLESGVWYGFRGRVRYGRFSIMAETMQGELLNDSLVSRYTDTDIRISRISLLVHVFSWVAVGPDLDVWRSVRNLNSLPRQQVVRRVGFGLDLSGTLGLAGLRVHLTAAIYPLGDVREPTEDSFRLRNGEANETNARALVTLEYHPPRTPLLVVLSYRGEWFVTETDQEDPMANDRLRGLQFGAGLRLSR